MLRHVAMTLYQARTALGLTQRQLDKLAGVGRNTTFDIEKGNIANPSWQVVQKLTKALQDKGLVGLRAEDIFGSGMEVSR